MTGIYSSALLACDAVSLSWWVPDVVPYLEGPRSLFWTPQTLKMKALGPFETSGTTNLATEPHVPSIYTERGTQAGGV